VPVGQAIGQLLPGAIGVALSPVPIIAVILMLATPRARVTGSSFAVGWVVGITAVSVIVLLLAGPSDDPDSGTSTALDWIKIVFGALFLFLALKQWQGRPKAGEKPQAPKWMATIDGFTAAKSFGFGVVLSALNPKNLALTIAAMAGVAQAGLSAGEDVVAIIVFVVIGSLTVAGPVVAYLLMGRKAEHALTSIKDWMTENNATIMIVLFLVLGVKIIGDGIAGL
jgi:threonine/homoserine/homoserine lactone efflux protein